MINHGKGHWTIVSEFGPGLGARFRENRRERGQDTKCNQLLELQKKKVDLVLLGDGNSGFFAFRT